MSKTSLSFRVLVPVIDIVCVLSRLCSFFVTTMKLFSDGLLYNNYIVLTPNLFRTAVAYYNNGLQFKDGHFASKKLRLHSGITETSKSA